MLGVPHVRQTNPDGRNSCVPACASMVLAFQGSPLVERELCDVLETQAAGTPVWNTLLLEQRLAGCRVRVDSLSFAGIRQVLDAGTPPIAFVATGCLGYWNRETIHAVVVVGLSDEEVYVNDPVLP